MCFSLFLVAAASAAFLGSPAAHAARPAPAERRRHCEIDVLLALQAHEERGDVTDLLAHADVPLPDEDTCMVDRFRKAEPEDLGLEPAFHDLGRSQAKHVIELLLTLQQQAKPDHAAEQSVSLKHPL